MGGDVSQRLFAPGVDELGLGVPLKCVADAHAYFKWSSMEVAGIDHSSTQHRNG